MLRPGAISSCSQSLSGERQGSLLAAIDRTVTGAGGRLLAARLAAPLAAAEPIQRRLDAIQALLDAPSLRTDLRAALRGCPDLERRSRACRSAAAARATSMRFARASPGRRRSSSACRTTTPARAERPLARRAGRARAPAPGRAGRRAAVPRPRRRADPAGWHAELDQLRGLRDQIRRHIARLEAELQKATGIGSLKVRHNNLLGYYIEVTATHRAKVPEHFVQRQSMANATRYSNKELAELESRIASAAERALTLEMELFEELCRRACRGGADRKDRAGARPPGRRGGARRAGGGSALLPPGGRRRRRLRDPGRPSSGGRAGARRAATPFIANDADLSDRNACGCSPARTWPARARSCVRTR